MTVMIDLNVLLDVIQQREPLEIIAADKSRFIRAGGLQITDFEDVGGYRRMEETK